MCTYDGIYLGPTGNWQGNVNVFDLEADKVKKPHTIVYLPVPDGVITTVNKWGRKAPKDTQIHKIDFLDCHKDKYARDNDDSDDNDIALVEYNVSHPHISAEMPGVELSI